MNCAGCNTLLVTGARLLNCKTCESSYHFECLNITPRQFEALTNEFKAAWKCPSCNNVTRRTRSNLHTPVQAALVPTHEDSMNMSCDMMEHCPASPCNSSTSTILANESVVQDSADTFQAFTNELHITLQGWRNDINNTLASFKDDIKSTLNGWRDEMDTSFNKLNSELRSALGEVRDEMSNLRTEHHTMKQNVSELSHKVAQLQTSVEFQSEEQVEVKKRLDEISRQNSEQSNLSISLLETKLDNLEQQARQCNVEILNMPESRSENLIHIMESIGAAIHFPVTQRDIISIHRVPHAHQQTNRPKNIIVKLSSRILRDNLLAAFRKVKNLKSDQLGFTCAPATIYMNEHLTLKKKHLFRKVKDVATLHQFKYVWIRNATILVRERDGDTAFAIHTVDDIRKIKSSPPNTNIDGVSNPDKL